MATVPPQPTKDLCVAIEKLNGKIEWLCSKMEDFSKTQSAMDNRISCADNRVRDIECRYVSKLEFNDSLNKMERSVALFTDKFEKAFDEFGEKLSFIKDETNENKLKLGFIFTIGSIMGALLVKYM